MFAESYRRWRSDLRSVYPNPRNADRIAFIKASIEDEAEQRQSIDYDERHVRQAIVHARQDLWILCQDNQDLITLSVASHQHLKVIRRLLWAIVIAAWIQAMKGL